MVRDKGMLREDEHTQSQRGVHANATEVAVDPFDERRLFFVVAAVHAMTSLILWMTTPSPWGISSNDSPTMFLCSVAYR
jgi:hypothetical protein